MEYRALNTTMATKHEGARRPPERRASIGILTYRRPKELSRCLTGVIAAIDGPMPDSWTIAEVLVIDNDPDGSAGRAVPAVVDGSDPAVPVRYIHEPTAGVATARNRALREATGDVLVFIDDDEIPDDGWPHGLLTVLDETGAAMVGGPVRTEFLATPPRWIVDGDFFDRGNPPHRSTRDWLRSGNLAVDLHQVRQAGLLFDPRYRQGEDSAFTRAARAAGLDLRWSSTGAVTEFVDAERFSPRWRAQREYLSNRSWTRSSLDLAGGTIGRAAARTRVAAVAVVRGVQGLTRIVAGVSTGRTAHRVEGLALLAGSVGRIVEIVSYRRP